MKLRTIITAAALAATSAIVAVPTTAQAAGFNCRGTGNRTNWLDTGQCLLPGQRVSHTYGGGFAVLWFEYQVDGNLVLMDQSNGLSVVWAWNRENPEWDDKKYRNGYLAMQDDGNLVLYVNNRAVFHTSTYCKGASYLGVGDLTGNGGPLGAAVFTNAGDRELWRANRNPHHVERPCGL